MTDEGGSEGYFMSARVMWGVVVAKWLVTILAGTAIVLLLAGCVSFEQDGKAHVRYANCDGQTSSGYGGKAALVTCKWHNSWLGS